MQLFFTFLSSRITQLLIRGLTFLFAALFGAESIKSPDAISAIEQGSNWLFFLITGISLDLIIHSGVYGKLQAWWKKYRGIDDNDGGISGGTPMALLILGVMITILFGCAQREKNRVAQSALATQQQAELAINLHKAGVTTPAQEAKIAALLHAEAAAEDAYYAAIEAGDSDAMKAAKAAWAAAVQAAGIELGKYTLPPIKPAEQPTGASAPLTPATTPK